MPELPEVESVASDLRAIWLGQPITQVKIHRRDIITGSSRLPALLQGDVLQEIKRHGKQLALIGASGRCVCVHLGMSGRLQALPTPRPAHTHVVWRFGVGPRLGFIDPRRFGGLWTFPSPAKLQATRWQALGPDALEITPEQLHANLSCTRRALKPALLDQAVIAGLGNIYVDEILFRCGLHPKRIACALPKSCCEDLVQQTRKTLLSAIKAGGSTLRDYRRANGDTGAFQNAHQVYGRSGQPCPQCGRPLLKTILAQRTTVYCAHCQPYRSGRTTNRGKRDI